MALDHDERSLAELGRHPGWAVLRQVAEVRMEREGQRLAHEFLRTNHQPPYEELQWKRGVFAGMKFLLDTPTVEAKKLERLLRRSRRHDVVRAPAGAGAGRRRRGIGS